MSRGNDEADEVDAADEVDEAIAGELRLMDPGVRSSRTSARELLDPHFVEVGASGRRWTYEEILAALPEMDGAADDGPRYEPSEMTGVVLAPGLVHLTYETTIGGDRARRSSLWRKGSAGATWQMYYHQATPVPPEGM
ncbi:nuclear transport factor 2 family protein [Streptomyces sp. NBC_01294]|uniref:nuclear transport factor 2 family protein n=1 Tax=Streptomyces sp. NBC_01294 TaxID=2903815 RepID=UPI002DD8F981|nr:nuclear transport factor 2 family protein [Streptomyces sp. NBC_01294]WRZ55136.1 nuclear transport factor 2 family protein [Streptomyces sp. NBC_01294]WRZ61565.1 nuclear transport factor 2 family protein [Streptomyces sp. NBC_01294]